MKINNIIKLITSWKIGDYIRQLSIVMVGIIVTFAGSNMITDYSQSKEIVNVLQLVKNELELNKKEVRRITERIQLERKACSYVLKYRDCIEKASEDTLRMYSNIPFQSRSFVYTKDAMELLKISSLFQKIQPRILVLQIIKSYSDLEITRMLVKDFYDIKVGYTNNLINSENFDFYDKKLYQFIRDFWRNFLFSKEGWNVCNFVVNNFSSEEPFQEIEMSLEKTIKMLEEIYQLE